MIILVYSSDSFGPRQIASLTWISKMAVFREVWKRFNVWKGEATENSIGKLPLLLFFLARIITLTRFSFSNTVLFGITQLREVVESVP